MHTAIIKALEERQRQINEEGFTAENDDQWNKAQLQTAAMCYLYQTEDKRQMGEFIFTHWPHPMHIEWFKPSALRKRNIIKAMALLSAEYDRLERAEEDAKGADIQEAFSTNGEVWHNDDLGQFIADQELIEGDEIERGEVLKYTGAEMCRWIDSAIIDKIQDQAHDEADEHASAYIDKLSHLGDEQKSLLKTLVSAWADNYAQPDFYQVAGATPYTLTAADIQQAINQR